MTDMLEAVLDRLPEIYRTVFVLREVEELATVEAAEALEVSEEVVKMRLHRARALVRDAFGGRREPAPRLAFPFEATRCDRVAAFVLGRIGQSTDFSLS